MNLKIPPRNNNKISSPSPSINAPKSPIDNNTGATKPSKLDRVSKYFPNQPGGIISAPNGLLVAYTVAYPNNKKV
jgi:hypothetical protein